MRSPAHDHRSPRHLGARALLIRISEAETGWPIALHLDDGSETWLNVPVASDLLPEELPPPPAPLQGEAAAAIRAFFLAQDEESDLFEPVGAYLHGLLRHGAIGTQWDEIAAAAGSRGLRLLLDLPEALSSLPWELMCDAGSWPAANVTAPLVRVGRGFPGAAALAPVRWPLRILVVIGARSDDREVAATEELSNLTHAFRRKCGQVDIEFLHRPTRNQVREKYAELRPHIFHFIGHGDVAEGRGRLLLDDHAWTTGEIRMDLRGWQPRLAILNACRSVSLEDQDGAWRVADAFADLGVPAVIAMQADIRGDAAADFTGRMYRALVAYEPLDVAVSHGRLVITDRTGFERRDFAVPTLTVNAPPESVLRMCFGVGEEHLTHVQRRNQVFSAFVDRAQERRRLWRELDPEPDDPHPDVQPAGVIAITGPEKVGKSELTRWCVGACELHGGNAAYVDLGGDHRLDWTGALERISAALTRSPVHRDRNRRAFETWRELAGPLGLVAVNGGPPPAADADDNAFSFFHDALRAAADERPLLLALDNVHNVLDGGLEVLCQNLLLPIALRNVEPVRVILALSDEQGERLDDTLKQAMGHPIALTTFKPEQFSYIAGHYLRYHFDVAPALVDEQLAGLPMTREFNWRAVNALEQFLEQSGWERFGDAA